MKLIVIFLGISALCFSQKFSAIYETKYKLSTEKADKINSDNMILDFENNRSIFRNSQAKENDSIKLNNGNEMFKMGVENQFYVKKDLIKNKIEKVITYLRNDYLIPIDEKLNWKISPEQKTIGKYKSQKAETNYGGRNWIAWFTTELPFSDGPYIFNGLPGLIISIQDSNNEYSFNLVQFKKGGSIFDARLKTLKIDWKKYENLGKSYFSDPFDLNSLEEERVSLVDVHGKKMDISVFIKEMQNEIMQENNPLELNHKINYK